MLNQSYGVHITPLVINCLGVDTHTHTHTHTHTRTHACMHVRAHTYTHTHIDFEDKNNVKKQGINQDRGVNILLKCDPICENPT